MRRVAAVWGLAVLLLLLGGAAARWLPSAWCPDLGLLLAVVAGLHLPGLPGCVAAWGVGWMTDLLSGSVLGQYACLRLTAWAATRVADRQFHLRRPLLLMAFVAFLTVLDAVGLTLLAQGLDGASGRGPEWLGTLLRHTLVNVLAAPVAAWGAARVLGRFPDRDGALGSFRLPARAPLP